MEILRSIPDLERIRGPVALSIGVFDGVHLGHLAVLRRALDDAAGMGGTAVALTFDPHPARILRPDRAPRLLTSTAHKAGLIEAAAMPYLLIVRFDAEFAAQAPEVFVRRLAAACHPLREICVGENWAFGANRSGNVALLRALGAADGFQVAEVASVQVDGAAVSSTRIREAIERGDLDAARRLLGRDYTILGTVEPGRRLGRSIGFPTANLRAHNEQFPPDGVYAVRVTLDGRTWNGVANVGYRPTVASDEPERKLEVHLFDFSGDLYDRDLDVNFIRFLRGERKFDGLDALKAQIASDAAEARRILG
ncbi:MAG: bifunctional riboflavin kinase/FAD synthetase [Terrimicrobiaceae bacterium]|nr:bifunctional riboflavin kinase/FAD synthetase [Terrimicrobiaceae bacterium]